LSVNNLRNNQQFFVLFSTRSKRVVCIRDFCRVPTAVNDVRFVFRVRFARTIIAAQQTLDTIDSITRTEKMFFISYRNRIVRILNVTFYWDNIKLIYFVWLENVNTIYACITRIAKLNNNCMSSYAQLCNLMLFNIDCYNNMFVVVTSCETLTITNVINITCAAWIDSECVWCMCVVRTCGVFFGEKKFRIHMKT